MAGSSQLCAGQLCGCEAAVHAIRDLFSSTDCEAVLLVDACNAFNFINRQNALHNIHSQCPALATVVINCYRPNIPLFIDGDVIFSAEGTTQGDYLAMIFYAIGILPLIHHLDEKSCSEIWYADDVVACGRISTLRGWWDGLCLKDHGYGYFPNGSKSWLIVKPVFWDLASSTVPVTDVNITTE